MQALRRIWRHNAAVNHLNTAIEPSHHHDSLKPPTLGTEPAGMMYDLAVPRRSPRRWLILFFTLSLFLISTEAGRPESDLSGTSSATMSDPSLYQQCYLDSLGSSSVLECISNRLEEQQASDQSNLAHWILVITGTSGDVRRCPDAQQYRLMSTHGQCLPSNLLPKTGSLVFFMQTGFASKNAPRPAWSLTVVFLSSPDLSRRMFANSKQCCVRVV